MSGMVERVARAMSVKDKGDDHWDVMSEDGDGYGYVGRNEYRAMARAAIEEWRHMPDDRFVLLLRMFNLRDDAAHLAAARDWHNRMIDAALDA